MAVQPSLIYNVTGQTLEFYPPAVEVLREGYPAAAASYSVWGGTQPNDDTAKFTGTATLDSVSTTINVDSGQSQLNRRKINLASTSGIVPKRRYVIENALQEREIVVPYEVGTSYVLVENDLYYDYVATTSTFKGLRQTLTVDATFITTQSNINVFGYDANTLRASAEPSRSLDDTDTQAPPYRVRWQYTVGGTTRQYWTYFDVVRQAARHGVTVEDLREEWPDISDREWREQRGQGYAPQIEEGWAMYQERLKAQTIDPDAIRDDFGIRRCVKAAALLVIARAGLAPQGRDVAEFIAEREKIWEHTFSSLISTLHTWMDTGAAGAISVKPAKQTWLER